MKSLTRDQSAYITFSILFLDAASGSGMAQPGNIPYTFTRTGTGAYTINFDTRFVPKSAEATGVSGMAMSVVISGLSPGVVSLIGLGSGGGLINTHAHISITARDCR